MAQRPRLSSKISSPMKLVNPSASIRAPLSRRSRNCQRSRVRPDPHPQPVAACRALASTSCRPRTSPTTTTSPFPSSAPASISWKPPTAASRRIRCSWSRRQYSSLAPPQAASWPSSWIARPVRPIAGAKVDAGFGQQLITTATTGADGVAQLAVPASQASQDNFWVVAGKGDEFAASTPGSYALSSSSSGKYAGYVYTERPVYRPTHTLHWKAILREHNGNALAIPKPGNVQVTISDENDKAVFDRSMPLSATGDVTGDFDLPKDASLGYYTIKVGGSPEDSISGGFHVEDYRKPEYRVQVTAAHKRVLLGETMPVTIDSRYFFGEPVAHAAVKYRIYHERHYWWGEAADDDASAATSADDPDADSQSNDTGEAGDEEAEQTGKLDANGLLVIQVPTHLGSQGYDANGDFDYTVEAGVTDAANREITGRGRFLATYGTFRVNVEPP